MNTCLFIDTNGKIRVNEFPLEPNYGDCHMYAAIDGLNPQVVYSDAMKAHRIAVQAALDNGVECEDQYHAKNILSTYQTHPDDMEPMVPYQIQGYKMEVNIGSCESPCTDECQENGCRGIQLAVLTLISNV